MRALAEFVMRGRPQAIGASVICAPLPLLHLLSTSIVSLVLLRKGPSEGVLVLAWTILPLAAVYWISRDPSPIMTLVGTAGLAAILRQTVSWQWVLAAAVFIAAFSAWLFGLVAPQLLDQWVEWYRELVEEDLQSRITLEEARHVLIGFFAMGQAWVMLGLLVLARWWQSHLFNPGGFKEEFHRLRLMPQLAAMLVILMVGCAVVQMPALSRWLPVLTVPLVLAALGLVHWALDYNKLSTPWVVGFYVLLVPLFQLIYPLLVAAALMDSWFDIRKRFETDEEV